MFDPILYSDLQYIDFEITSSKIRIDNDAVVCYFFKKKNLKTLSFCPFNLTLVFHRIGAVIRKHLL